MRSSFGLIFFAESLGGVQRLITDKKNQAVKPVPLIYLSFCNFFILSSFARRLSRFHRTNVPFCPPLLLLSDVNEMLTVAKDAVWLTEKFGDGVYDDVAGLCKIATRAEIAQKNSSLTPGAYVGVAEVTEEDENFEERMKEIHTELVTLQKESNEFMNTISANLKELGLGDK